MKKLLGTKKELESQPAKKTEIVRIILHFLLAHLLSCLYKLVKMLSVCLDVNQGGTNHSRCTQRLVMLSTQAY